jgi:hypothetical protein
VPLAFGELIGQLHVVAMKLALWWGKVGC